jgi:3-hydroxy-9,10-secoandrosta-1,3,5(10)-triene-9,17-dione monooxygenase
MRTIEAAAPIAWAPSATLPRKPASFADVGYEEMLARARTLAPTLAARATACEQLRRLPDDTERDLHAAGLFRMVQPRRAGGAELDIGILVDVCAEIARVCPSTSWNVGNLSSHHWMLGYFDPRIQDELWDASPDVLIATSLAFPAGRGRKVDGGYEVSGRWPLSSGVDNSDWNMLAFMVRESDDGPPVDQRFCMVHRSQYEIVDTWHAVGLAGTGSKDVAIKQLFVPDYRTITAWSMNGETHLGSPVNTGPLFRLPMLALGPFVLSGVMLGCAQGAYETVVGAARTRNATTTGLPVGAGQSVQIKVAEASARIDTAEEIMRRVCAQAMTVARSDRGPTHDEKLRYRRDAFFSTRLCLEAVDILMGVAGSSGLYTTGPMQRLFRDAHAANAHVMFSPDIQGALFGQNALGVKGAKPLL